MKKFVCLLLSAILFLAIFSGCSVDLDDMGSIIPMRLASPQTDLDPTKMIYDKDFVKFSGLVYEPLTNITSSGSIEDGVCYDWKTKYDDEREEYFLYLNLSSTKWNDGRQFNAYHVVYAWKNILSPQTDSPAACLLYDIKNAKAVKAGNTELTVDDVCVSAITSKQIEIQFEKPIDEKLFLEAISSPSLVPLRDDVITVKGWATNPDDIGTNGKFVPKSISDDSLYKIEFSKFYKLSTEFENGYNEYVKPYYLITDYSKSAKEALEQFKNNEIYYVGELSKEDYAENEKDIETSDTLQSYTYFFNCNNKVLSDPKVRKALSISLDREEIASIIGLGTKASKGFVTDAAFGSSLGKSYRKEAGNLYKTTADLETAKSLVKEASASGTILLSYRNDREYDVKVAEYVKSVWDSLGFKVTLVSLDADDYKTALYTGDFDVISLDYQGLSTSAYSFLAPFATGFSGAYVDVGAEEVEASNHVTGYKNEEYNAIFDAILQDTNRGDRVDKLINAEKIFCEECPAIALVDYVNYYLKSDELKGLNTSPYGYTLFDGASLKDYETKNTAYLNSLEK